jgi:hypothetical protein
MLAMTEGYRGAIIAVNAINDCIDGNLKQTT